MKLIYENPLSCEADIKDFVLEGSAKITFPEGKMRMENALSANEGQNANYVLWCPMDFPSEVRALHTCNLRKSYGFHLVSQGGDPIPDADECNQMYKLAVEKKGNLVCFLVEEVEVFRFEDDGKTYGPLLKGGKIGFRQLAPMIGEYADLKVYGI